MYLDTENKFLNPFQMWGKITPDINSICCYYMDRHCPKDWVGGQVGLSKNLGKHWA